MTALWYISPIFRPLTMTVDDFTLPGTETLPPGRAPGLKVVHLGCHNLCEMTLLIFDSLHMIGFVKPIRPAQLNCFIPIQLSEALNHKWADISLQHYIIMSSIWLCKTNWVQFKRGIGLRQVGTLNKSRFKFVFCLLQVSKLLEWFLGQPL